MTNTVRDQLRGLDFLDGLTDTAVHQLSRLVREVEYDCDSLFFEEGSERQLLALIVSGAVAIEKRQNGRPVRLATLGPGEAVGEGLEASAKYIASEIARWSKVVKSARISAE